jgi:FkbM family methyltransferase
MVALDQNVAQQCLASVAGSTADVAQQLKIITVSQPWHNFSFPMAVLAGDDAVSRMIEKDGFWEVRTTPEMLLPQLERKTRPHLSAPARISEPRVFLDIGANIGYFTLLHAFAGYHVVAVEAMEQNRRALRTSLCLNPTLASRVTLVATALGSYEQVAASPHCITYTVNRNRGNGITRCERSLNCSRLTDTIQTPQRSYKADWRRFQVSTCEQVSLRTLDEVIGSSSWPPGVSRSVHTMKMDVEGSESNVLAGATKLFEPSNAGRPRYARFEVGFDDVSRMHLGSRAERTTRELAASSGYAVVVTGWNASWSAAYNRAHNPYALHDRTAYLTRQRRHDAAKSSQP